MTEHQMQDVADAGRRCEQLCRLSNTYAQAGDFASAEHAAWLAEIESRIAFQAVLS